MRRSRSEASSPIPIPNSPAVGVRAPNVLAIGALLLLLGSGGVAAQGEGSARECCRELLAPVGARALALGDAIGARPSFGALLANPALVARLQDDMFVVHTSENPAFEADAFTLLIQSELIGLLGVTYSLIDYGEIATTDDFNQEIGRLKSTVHTLTATYATTIAAGLSAGLSYQLYHSRHDCRGFCNAITSQAATTHLVDAGVHYTPAFVPKLELGASVMHLGFPLQVKNAEQAAPTPSRARLAAAHEVLQHIRQDSLIQLWIGADALVPFLDPGATTLNAGAEISFDDTIFLWGGYGGGGVLPRNAGLGLGVEYNRFSLAVARAFVETSLGGGDPFQVTFGIRF
jgi:hypothetical protein